MKTLILDRKIPGGRGKALKQILKKAKLEGYERVIFRDPTRQNIVNNCETQIILKNESHENNTQTGTSVY